MKTRIANLLASLALAFVAVTGCTVKNQATDKICQPKQKSHCNDCPKPDPSDTRVYIGWNTCSDDGKSYVGGCTECAPEHPMATSPTDGPKPGGGDPGAPVAGNAKLTPAPDDVSSAAVPDGPTGDPGSSASDVSVGSSSNASLPVTDDPGSPVTCHSATLSLDVPQHACAWSSTDNDWEQCVDGHWYLGVYSDDTGTFGPGGTCSEIHDSP